MRKPKPGQEPNVVIKSYGKKKVAVVKLDLTEEVPRKVYEGRGQPFKKGNPYTFKPGQSGNPTGIQGRNITVISKAYVTMLSNKVPAAMARQLGFDPDHPVTWAEALAAGMLNRAVTHDTPAAKEIREVTEGKLPESLNLDGKIDYTAGAEAKDILAGKLGIKQGG
jgi:hypothetical protein